MLKLSQIKAGRSSEVHMRGQYIYIYIYVHHNMHTERKSYM